MVLLQTIVSLLQLLVISIVRKKKGKIIEINNQVHVSLREIHIWSQQLGIMSTKPKPKKEKNTNGNISD